MEIRIGCSRWFGNQEVPYGRPFLNLLRTSVRYLLPPLPPARQGACSARTPSSEYTTPDAARLHLVEQSDHGVGAW